MKFPQACAASLATSSALSQTLIVQAGRLVDGERGCVLTHHAIRIEHDRIVSVAEHELDMVALE